MLVEFNTSKRHPAYDVFEFNRFWNHVFSAMIIIKKELKARKSIQHLTLYS